MLMADDRSEPMGFDGSTFVEDDDGLTLDLNLFWEIMAEDNTSDPPEQNSPEDLSEGKQQNVNLSSDAGNGEAENSQQMGLMQPERTMSSWEQFWGPDDFIPSYNSEASDLRVGISQGSFNFGANSVTPDYVKQDASTTQFGSPMHSCSESLADWTSQVPRYDSFGAGSKNVIQNFTSFSTDDSKRTQYEQPNCTDSFSFPAGAVNAHSEFTANLGSGDLKPEAVFQFMCPQGHSNTQYGEHSTFLGNPDINYQQFCGSEANSFQTLVAQDLLDTSMIDMNMPIPWDLDGNCNIKKDEGVTGIQDEMTDFPTQFSRLNGLITPDVQVGESGQSVVPLSGTPTFSGRILKRENDNLVLRRGGMSLSKAGKPHTIDRRSMVYKQANVKQLNQVKDDNRDEQVLSQAKTSLSISHSMNTNGICKGFTAEKRARPLLPRILPSSSSEKLVIPIKDEKDLFKESKRARHTLCNDEDKKVNLVVDDRCSDVQVSEQPCSQPFSSMKQLDCKEDEGDSKLIQRSSIDTQISKASCRTVHTTAIVNSFDDDADVCIIENLSDPSRASRPINTKHVASHAAVSDSVSHMGMGGTKFRANDERLIFRAVVQDLSQPKTEANPPDGLLAVPLLRHQRIALSWMVQKETASLYCSGGILADDQGLGKTISTIALILKERAPSSKNSPDDVKTCERETLNLDDDDDCESEVIQLKQNDASCSAVSDGTSIRSRDCHVEAKGRPAAGTLVVCPTSVLRQWADELHNKVTREANLSVLIYHGGSRTKDHLELTKYDVVLTTYAIVSMEVPKQPLVDRDEDDRGRKEARIVPPLGLSSSKKRKYPPGSNKQSKKDKKGIESELLECTARPLAKVGWFRVILDEAQSIKNHRTQVARACWGLRAKRRWCLSGTPIQNAVDDLYSYFRFLRYDPYAVYKSFCSTIKVPINRNPTNGYKKLQAVLKTIMLRRTKGTFLDGEPIINLPPKTVELKKVVFSDEERDFYCRLESDSRAQFAEYAAAGTVKQNYVNILLMLLRLRQACDHPLLVRGYSSTSAWRSSVDMAKKLPREKQICLLNCLEASLALCGICNDPPEDAVVTSCGHVFCNQCICEHLTGDDNQCPTKNCKNRLSSSSVFSTDTLKCSLSEQPGQDDKSNCLVSRNSDKLDLSSLSQASDSSKIKAALEVLQSLSKPVRKTRTTTSSLTLLDESAPCQDTLCDSVVEGVELDVCDGEKSTLDESSSDTVQIVGEKAIVFSQWTRMLDLLESCLKDSSIQYRRLDGTMSVLARDKAVKDFNTVPEVSVMIMSLKAASLGLNMVAACHVILLDLWWNPTTEDQAVDRAHRIGQTRPVKVLRLTVKDTVEDRILALQQKKREMVASAFGEDEAGGRQTRLTVEDLKYLFMA